MAGTFAAFSMLAIILCIIALQYHAKHRNIPACALIVWLIISNIIGFISIILWPNFETLYTAWDGHIFCDIASRLSFTTGAGEVSALAAIARNLAFVMGDRSTAAFSRSEKRKKLIIDLVLCFTLPVWLNIIWYPIQQYRYILVNGTGCVPAADESWLPIVVFYIWPPILTTIAAYYSGEHCPIYLSKLYR